MAVSCAGREGPRESLDAAIVGSCSKPFHADGGLRLLRGNLGRAVVKTSAVADEHRIVEAPARVFRSQEALKVAFEAGELECDFIAVIQYQGPRANGMPELHKLTPVLGVLQDRGFKVALVTDGRMSGASGKVPAAIHVTPECLDGGPLARVRDGDLLRLDTVSGTLQAQVDDSDWQARDTRAPDLADNDTLFGRELFGAFRRQVSGAESGAISAMCID